MVDKVHDTGDDLFRTPMSNKHNFSCSSTSPKVDGKKPKIFVTPNRLAALYSNDSSDNVFNTPTNRLIALNEKPTLAKQNIKPPTLNKIRRCSDDSIDLHLQHH